MKFKEDNIYLPKGEATKVREGFSRIPGEGENIVSAGEGTGAG